MNSIEHFVNLFAKALSTTAGFICIVFSIIGCLLIGIPLHFGGGWLLFFDTYLSLSALIIAATILIAQRRDTAAIQAKLDHLMMHGDGDNRLVGIELRRTHEIEEIRSSNQDKAAE
jgi:low affinity Fe/Cu permease